MATNPWIIANGVTFEQFWLLFMGTDFLIFFKNTIIVTVCVVAITMVVSVLAAFSLSPWLWLAFPLLFVAGFGYLSSNTAATSRLQLGVEEHQRGRIMALWSVAFLGLRPFASLADGGIADVAGVRTAGVALAVPTLVLAAVVRRRARRLGDEI